MTNSQLSWHLLQQAMGQALLYGTASQYLHQNCARLSVNLSWKEPPPNPWGWVGLSVHMEKEAKRLM